MSLYKWSQIAALDATADASINWQEGQSPSSVNDSARAMMAATAKYRDDISGAIATGGTSTAYSLSSYQSFDSLSHLNGQIIAFTPHVTNGGAVTLNVDALGGKPLRSAPGTDLFAGTVIQGTPYIAVYSNTDSAFYLHGVFGSPYTVPLGASLDYWGNTVPNSAFAFPVGQAISRATYAALFSLIGTMHGNGDGSTTFNLPDLTGRVTAMKESVATRLTVAGSGIDGGILGANGGVQSRILTTANLPPYTPTGTVANGAISVTTINTVGGALDSLVSAHGIGANFSTGFSQAPSLLSMNAQGGTSAPFANIQPTIICNKIIRII